MDQRCAHVGCLLYLVEDLSLQQDLKVQRACTTLQQAWGKGSTRNKNPTPVHEKSYSKKRPLDRYIEFDPRPDDTSAPDTDKFLRDLQELPGLYNYSSRAFSSSRPSSSLPLSAIAPLISLSGGKSDEEKEKTGGKLTVAPSNNR